MSGGEGFSIININSFETTRILNEHFSDLRQFGEYLLFSQKGTDSETTSFKLLTYEGALSKKIELQKNCYFQHSFPDQIMIQCEMKSYLLDQALNMAPFFDNVLTITPAPNSNAFVMVRRTGWVFLLDADLHLNTELKLEETSLEIQWHPDSMGFLYRTHGKLYNYDLVNQVSHLLIESDLFTDYTGLNAVWINLE